MGKIECMTKAEIYRRMDRFQADSSSAFSWKMFSELVGVSESHLRNVFIARTEPMTEITQIRVDRALKKMEAGEVTVMRNKDRSRFVKYNKEPDPRPQRTYTVNFQGGNFTVKTGLKARYDYSKPTLKEQLGD